MKNHDTDGEIKITSNSSVILTVNPNRIVITQKVKQPNIFSVIISEKYKTTTFLEMKNAYVSFICQSFTFNPWHEM